MEKIEHFSALRYPCPVGEFVTLAVLVARPTGYRAYQVIVPDVSVDDPTYSRYQEWAYRNGNRLSLKDAQKFFPHGLSDVNYD
jgi:hypothetical protein